jgi:hypothetical protein
MTVLDSHLQLETFVVVGPLFFTQEELKGYGGLLKKSLDSGI